MEFERKKLKQEQIASSYPIVVLLTMSGGFQDAYTYFVRGHVFANAQTGNIVLMASQIAQGHWRVALQYLVPLCFFLAGVFVVEQLQAYFHKKRKAHFRNVVLLFEAVLLGVSTLVPSEYNILANGMISFVCSMQVQAFRYVNDNAFASTMCIGNMRSGMECLSKYLRLKEDSYKQKALDYLRVILLFFSGACLGYLCSNWFGVYAIYVSCCLLMMAYIVVVQQAK